MTSGTQHHHEPSREAPLRPYGNGDHGAGHDTPGHEHGHEHEHEHAPLQSRRRPLSLTAVLLALVAYGLSGVRIVGPAERGVIRRFGRVVSAQVRSGVHLGLPWGMDKLTRVEMRKARRVVVGMATTDRLLGSLPDPSQSQFLTGDRNLVTMQVSIQYVVEDARDFLFGCRDPEGAVRRACEAALCEVVSGMTIDSVLTLRRAAVQRQVLALAQQTLERHRIGVRLLSVTQERSAPPEGVADAFRAVTSARADKGRKVAEAEGYRDYLLPETRGQAVGIRRAGEADAFAVVALAEGKASRFESLLSEASRAPEVTRYRLYTEMLEQVLPKTRKIIMTADDANGIRLVEESP